MPTIHTSAVWVCQPASHPGANFVYVPAAPAFGSPQSVAEEAPALPALGNSVKVA
jgi:hypothetical protein